MIYVVAFDPIKIKTCDASQNDHQHLSFVKDCNVASKKRPEIVVTWPTHTFVTFLTGQSLHTYSVVFLSKHILF